MTILITNDDGIKADGIAALGAALLSAGHEVWTCAPASNRSAQSHAMTIAGGVDMTPMGENSYACSGTPTDCVLYSIKGRVFPRLPDLVVSGINHGYNCSSDILYSGTCSAASEAVLQGVPAIALSHEADGEGRYEFGRAAAFAARNLDKIMALLGSDTFCNLNFPPHFREEFAPSVLGAIHYGDEPVRTDREDGSFHLALKPGVVTRGHLGSEHGRTDLENASDGLVALTVVRVTPAVDHEAHERALSILG